VARLAYAFRAGSYTMAAFNAVLAVEAIYLLEADRGPVSRPTRRHQQGREAMKEFDQMTEQGQAATFRAEMEARAGRCVALRASCGHSLRPIRPVTPQPSTHDQMFGAD
jgi:hypothetical protein